VFLSYVLFGAVLVMRWPATWRLHAACSAWGLFIELTRFTCPLTTLEKWLRVRGGQPSYTGGFWEEYVVTQILPGGLPRPVQTSLVVATTALAAAAYVRTFRLRSAAIAQLAVPLEAPVERVPVA
jgi:hypothetical protein